MEALVGLNAGGFLYTRAFDSLFNLTKCCLTELRLFPVFHPSETLIWV